MPRSSGRLTGAVLVGLAAIAFSGKAILLKLAFRHGVDPLTMLALRMALSAPFFLAILWWASRGAQVVPMTPRERGFVAALGLVGYYLASLFDFLGLQYITAALERLLLFIHPTFVVLMSAALFGRAITGRDIVAMALCYGGIALVFWHDLHTQQGQVVLGSAWVLLSAVFYAAYLVGSGRMVATVGSLRLSGWAGLASCGGVLAHSLLATGPGPIVGQPAAVYGLAFVMAAVCTVMPIVFTSEGIRRIGASHASMIGTVGPVATIFLGAIFLGEPITFLQLAGAAVVMAGVLIISLARN